jgi:uncharacterized membrane protein YdjX (TVP38/TMEM64 family)
MPMSGSGTATVRVVGGALLVAGAALFALLAWRFGPELEAIARVSEAELEALMVRFGPYAALVSVLLMIVHSFVPFPAEALAMANGMLFGIALGVALTWIGAMLGAVLAFVLARWLGRPLGRQMLSERRWRQIAGWGARQGCGPWLAARLIPVISFNLINYAAGLTGLGWWTFLWTTGLGILPLTVVSVVVGAHMLRAPWQLWLVFGLGAIVLWLVCRRIARRHEVD